MDTIAEAVKLVLLLTLYIGPLALAWWFVRSRRNRAARMATSKAQALPAEEPDATRASTEPEPERRYSFDIGSALIYLVLLAGALAGARRWWGLIFQAIYLLFLIGFAWTTFSRTQFEKARDSHPDTTRETWIFNFGVFYVLVPLVVWLVAGLPVLLATLREW